MSSGEFWRVRCANTYKAFCAHVWKDFEKYGDVTYRWRYGPDRSLDQNSLFNVWLREWVAYKLNIRTNDVTKAQHASMKRTVKSIFYQNTAAPWMVHQVQDMSVPNGKVITDFTSSGDWGKGEMFQVLTFMQDAAAMDGLVLESLGEFARNQRKQNGV